MSMTAFELMAKLSLDKKEYDAGLNNAENEGRNAGSKIGNALGNAAKVGMGLLTAATGAAATGLGILGKQAVSSYAQYEQLIGGVEKLYGEASDKLIAYAHEGYMTAGMSANQYMEIATSFSSALINSLGGDMDKAADMTDLAMQSISDNVNIFGSNMESVQNAFQGFAKGQYMLLDNLKLGYGGTKTEMERLIKDASQMTEEQKELNVTVKEGSLEFDNIVSAIAVVQKHMNIAGTTAKEAMRTIEGSARATQAAWKNVITAIAGGGDLEKAFGQLTESVFGDGSEGTGLLANIIPRVQQVMEGIGQFVSKASPYITKYIPQLFEAILPPLLNSATELVVSLAKALPDIIKVIIETIPRLMQIIANAIKKEFPVIGAALEGLSKVVEKLFGFITNNGKAVVRALEGVLAAFVAFKTINFLKSMIPQLTTLITGFVTTLTSTVSAMELMGAATAGLTGVMGTLTGAVGMLNTVLLANPIGLIVGAIVAAVAVLGFAIYQLATQEEAIKSLDEATKNYEETVKNLASAQSSYFNATKAMTEAQEQLAKAQEETGLSGADLYEQFNNGTLAYQDMNAEQKRVLEAYVDMIEKEQLLKEKTEELSKAQGEELVASFQKQASAIKENGGDWNELGANIRKAFDEGKIGTEEMQELFSQAMTEMDMASRATFVQNLPEDMRYASLVSAQEQSTIGQRWDNLCSDIDKLFGETTDSVSQHSTGAFENVTFTWQDIGNWFGDRWNDISDAFSGAADWFGAIFGFAKGNIENIWSNIGQWFSDRWNDISNAFSGVGDWFSNVFQSAKDGVTNIWNDIGDYFSGLWEDIKNAFDLSEALEWGSDLIDNFVQGIKNAWGDITGVLEDLAQLVKDFIGFSEPKKGPLSNFHTYAPDMMNLFAKGVKDNKKMLIDTVADAFDFDNVIANGTISGTINSDGKSGFGTTYNFYQTNNSPKSLSTIEIYRQTRNQFSQLKGAML